MSCLGFSVYVFVLCGENLLMIVELPVQASISPCSVYVYVFCVITELPIQASGSLCGVSFVYVV